MKRFQYLILLVAVLLTACQMGAAEPTATPIPPPTDTPEPTVTPLPTDTATPIPTATPDAAATAAAQSTSEASKVLSELNKVLGESEIPYKSGHLVWQQTEPVKINMQGPQATDKFVSIDENLSLKNFVMKSDVVWNANGILICGAIFRSEADLDLGKQYQFYFYRISGLPAYFIDVYKDGLFLNSITKDRFSDSLDIDNGASNQFLLVAQDNQFTVYLNGAREGRYFDNSSQRNEGYFGFLAWQQSGKGSCEFKNTWIWALDE